MIKTGAGGSGSSSASAHHAKRRQIVLLRAGYWIFAVFELLAIAPMFSPSLFARVMGIPDFNPGPDYTYAMAVASVFTLGWIGLVLWAERRPVQRRGVMLLTAFPVLAGNVLCGVYAATSGFVTTTVMTPSWIVQLLLIALFAWNYHVAGELDRQLPG